MMTQVQTPVDDKPAIAQSKFEKYTAQQADAMTWETATSFSMVQSFVSGASDSSNTPVLSQTYSQVAPNREPLKHLLIGSPKAVTSTIHYLQVIGYAQVGDWSPLLPSPNPGEVMSILSRQILVQ